MKKVILILLVFILAVALLPLSALPVFSDSYISNNISITFDDKGVALRPDMIGMEASDLLEETDISISPSDEVRVETGPFSTYVAEKTEDGYKSLMTSWDMLVEGREYYYVFCIMRQSGYIWDQSTFPSVTINGRAADDYRWGYTGESSPLYVYYKTDCSSGNNYVTGVTISPEEAKVQKGKTYQFSAEATGTDTSITWSIVGDHVSGTTVSDTGLLSVASNETNEVLTVRASSGYNPGKYADASVGVSLVPVVIESVTISPKTVSLHPGENCEFTYEVTGTDLHEVSWSVSGSSTSGSNVYQGKLHVDKNETASTLRVRVTSQRDPSKYDEAVVTVIPNPIVTHVDITYYASMLNLSTSNTGRGVTQALLANYTASPGDAVYVIAYSAYTCICRKEGDEFVNLEASDELLDPSGDYYLRFYVQTYQDGSYLFDLNDPPTVNINGKAADLIEMIDDSYTPIVAAYCKVTISDIIVNAVPSDKLGNTYSISGSKVTVSYDLPCKLGYLSDGKYVAIPAIANGDGTYSFDIPANASELVLVIKGDATGDGAVNLGDAARIKAVFRRKTELSDISAFAADITGDGTVNLGDAARITAIFRKKTTNNW